MKKQLLLTAALFVATAASAQAEAPLRPKLPAMVKATAADHGIITEQPEGTLRLYQRTGKATYPTIYFKDDPQDGILAEVVFSEDGKKAWFHNIISHAASGAWVEGSIEGNVITVPLGQMYYWWDKDDNGNTNYGMQLARVKVNGSIHNYTSDTKGNVTFIIEGDDLYLQGTSGDSETTTYDGLGLVYTGAFAGEWSYYIDYETVMHFKDVHAVVPPADMETEVYSMEFLSTMGQETGQLVEVGFSGRNVYVHGASRDQVPDAWMQGEVDRNKLVFPLQYAGSTTSFMVYFAGADAIYEQDQQGYWNWRYYWSDGSTNFDFDQMRRTFSTQQALLANSSDTGVDRAEVMLSPSFRPFTEVPATPVDPAITYYQDMGAFKILVLNVPLKSTEDGFLNPEKVSYQLFVDDEEEPFVFYPDEYKQLTEPIDEVPYFFPREQKEMYERSYIYEKGSYVYLFQNDLQRIGIQAIYRGGDEEHRSNIFYYDIADNNAISATTRANSATTRQFDLMGRPAAKAHKGLTISRRADGTVVKHLQR